MIFGNEVPFHLKPIPYRGIRKHQAEVLQHPPGYQHPIVPLSPHPLPTAKVAGVTRSATCSTPSSSTSSLSRAAPPAAAAAAAAAAVGGGSAPRITPPTPPTPPVPLLPPPHLLYHPRTREDSGRGGDAFMSDAERLDPTMTVDAALQRERARERENVLEHRQARRARAAAREAALHAARNATFEAEQRRMASVAGTARGNRGQDDRDPVTHHCYTAEARQARMERNAEARVRYTARQKFLDRQMNSTEFNIVTWLPR
ncbi:hypothetical protein NESM_000526800 [Novymonas esmeraldas]|uniref:Uncharacterized protein n=1 Tax=Novymonas esmeraldas TaxID=1808958 RepID=A0AAW0ER21_9TRYP